MGDRRKGKVGRGQEERRGVGVPLVITNTINWIPDYLSLVPFLQYALISFLPGRAWTMMTKAWLWL